MVDSENFIIGTYDKYDKRLLENRIAIEGNVVAILLQDLTNYDDCGFDIKDFISRDGRFLFMLGRNLRQSGYALFDEVTLYSQCSDEMKDRVASIGGFKAIQHLMDVVNPKNIDAIFDDFRKSNIILRLYRNGFNLFTEIELENQKKIVPFDFFKNLTSSEVIDWYDSKISTFGVVSNNKITGEEFVSFDEAFFEKIHSGDSLGTSYSDCGLDVDGKKISTFPFLSGSTLGLGTGLHAIVGHAGTGKTVISLEIILSLVANGRRFVIVENEMQIEDLKIIILTFILTRFLNYTNLTKRKIISGIFNDEDRKMLKEASEYWNKNFNKSIKIVSLSDSDSNLTCQIIKKSILRDGFDGFFVDTFKLDNVSTAKNDNFWIGLIEDSKKLHSIALKYNVCGIVSIQLALATLGRLWLDKSCLSTAKGVCEVLDTCIGIRAVVPDELIPGSPIYCSPFRSHRKENGEWEELQYDADPNNVWRMLFIIKNRKGVCSDDNGVTFLIRYSGDFCSMYETSKARSSRRTLASYNG